MNNLMKFALCILIHSLFVVGCGDQEPKEDKTVEYAKTTVKLEAARVKVIPVKREQFNSELLSNGKLAANKSALLPFKVGGTINSVLKTNGSRVTANEVIASIEERDSQIRLIDAKMNLTKAQLDFHDRLLREGIALVSDSSSLGKDRLYNIKLASGYLGAQTNYERALYDFQHTKVRAPFAGIISDMDVKEFNHSSNYKHLCTLIDDSRMEVIFKVLETEVGGLRKGMNVEVSPYALAGSCFIGKVVAINPRVDNSGMVKVKALLDNNRGELIDGMNVRILLKRAMDNCLIVPRSAVLPRQGKKIVFVHKDGKAHWTYVTTEMENSSEVSISSGLKEGDEVIYMNNLGLSHESDVVVVAD